MVDGVTGEKFGRFSISVIADFCVDDEDVVTEDVEVEVENSVDVYRT